MRRPLSTQRSKTPIGAATPTTAAGAGLAVPTRAGTTPTRGAPAATTERGYGTRARARGVGVGWRLRGGDGTLSGMAFMSGLRLERARASKQYRDGTFHNTSGKGPSMKGASLPVIGE